MRVMKGSNGLGARVSDKSPHETPSCGYRKVAHGQAVMMTDASSQLNITLVAAFKNWIMRVVVHQRDFK